MRDLIIAGHAIINPGTHMTSKIDARRVLSQQKTCKQIFTYQDISLI